MGEDGLTKEVERNIGDTMGLGTYLDSFVKTVHRGLGSTHDCDICRVTTSAEAMKTQIKLMRWKRLSSYWAKYVSNILSYYVCWGTMRF
jgi:hypothetical protein